MPEDQPFRWPSDEEPEPRGRGVSQPRRRLRLWMRAASIVLIIGGLVLWLLPVTALYYLDDNGEPYDITTIYGTRSDQTMFLPSNLEDPDSTEPVTVLTSVRLGCGTVFSSGENEAEQRGGSQACQRAESLRTFLGMALGCLGGLGLVAGFRRASPRSS